MDDELGTMRRGMYIMIQVCMIHIADAGTQVSFD